MQSAGVLEGTRRVFSGRTEKTSLGTGGGSEPGGTEAPL